MAKTALVKVVCSTKKTVILRELKISHTETAAQMVAARSNGDMNLLQLLIQKALLQLLLVSVDGKDLTAEEKENMDAIFKPVEYGQLLKVIGKMSGGDEMGKEPTIELVSSG